MTIENTNTYLVRLSKDDASHPWYGTISLHKSLADLRSSSKKKTETSAAEPTSEPKDKSPFQDTFEDFWSGVLELLSGASFLRAGFSLITRSFFSFQAEEFLKDNAVQVGKTRRKFRYYLLSDKKIRPLISILRERRETFGFSQNIAKMLIPALVAHFDAFILKTINDILKAKPEIANSIEKTVSLRELLAFPNIETARAAIIDKEIDSVMRDSHEKHLSWISERVGAKIEPEKGLKEQFFELCERRNIIIHNGGRVNSQYLKNCERYGIDVSKLKEGDLLHVDLDYLSRSVSCLIEMATKISQVSWRKLDAGNANEADRTINNVTYELIYRRKYKLAIRLFSFCRTDVKKWASDEIRLMTIINHANALRLSGDKEGAKKLLNSEDWSARSLNFRMCAYSVLEQYEECVDMFNSHHSSIGIGRVDYADWPVFEGLREYEPFKEAFRNAFGEDLADEIQAEVSGEES